MAIAAVRLQPSELAVVRGWATSHAFEVSIFPSERLLPPPPLSSFALAAVDIAGVVDLTAATGWLTLCTICVGERGVRPSAAEALRAGAVDYVTRGIDADELSARLDARMPHAVRTTAPTTCFVLDANERCVLGARANVFLRPAEYALLEYLAFNSPHACDARLLVRSCLATRGDGGSVRTHLSRVRAKFRSAGMPDPIQTFRGLGYRLAPGVIFQRAGSVEAS